MRTERGNPAWAAWLIVAGLLVFMLAFAAGCGGDDDRPAAASDDRA